MIAPMEQVVVVVPAHDEAELLAGCLRSVRAAAARVCLPVLVVAVLDACGDGSAAVAAGFPEVQAVVIDAGNVGVARAAGFGRARAVCDSPAARTWYACTDADSEVDPDWLQRQLNQGADMVLGVVRVPRWQHYSSVVAERYQHGYQRGRHDHGGGRGSCHGHGHGHVHGANLGCRADHYWRLGGFRGVATGEDVDLVERFVADGCHVVWDAELSVATSDRRVGRAPHGFADHLATVSREVTGR